MRSGSLPRFGGSRRSPPAGIEVLDLLQTGPRRGRAITPAQHRLTLDLKPHNLCLRFLGDRARRPGDRPGPGRLSGAPLYLRQAQGMRQLDHDFAAPEVANPTEHLPEVRLQARGSELAGGHQPPAARRGQSLLPATSSLATGLPSCSPVTTTWKPGSTRSRSVPTGSMSRPRSWSPNEGWDGPGAGTAALLVHRTCGQPGDIFSLGMLLIAMLDPAGRPEGLPRERPADHSSLLRVAARGHGGRRRPVSAPALEGGASSRSSTSPNSMRPSGGSGMPGSWPRNSSVSHSAARFGGRRRFFIGRAAGRRQSPTLGGSEATSSGSGEPSRCWPLAKWLTRRTRWTPIVSRNSDRASPTSRRGTQGPAPEAEAGLRRPETSSGPLAGRE